MGSKRDSRVEILRIISMLMIVAHHYVFYGVRQSGMYHLGGIINRCIASFFNPGGIVGVAIFFIITGYFGVKSEKNTCAKVVRDVYFYSWLCILIYFAASGLVCADKKMLAMNFFLPLSSSAYWFVSVYIILSLCKSVLNNVVKKIKRNYLMLFLVYFWLIGYFLSGVLSTYYFAIMKGMFFYFVGAYIGLHVEKIKISRTWGIVLGIGAWIIYAIGEIVASYTGKYVYAIEYINSYIWGVIAAIAFFLAAIQGTSFCVEKINVLSSCTMAVYLLHDNKLIREMIWGDIFKVASKQYLSDFFLIYAILTIGGIYVVCVVFDLFKKRYFDKVLDKQIRRVREKVEIAERR